MSWNTVDIDWEDIDTLYNAPGGLLLDDLLNATTERFAALGFDFLDPEKLDINAPVVLEPGFTYLRDAMVICVNGTGNVSPVRKRYVKPVSGVYDWTDESDIPRWDMTEMEAELGPEPSHGFNVPLTAEWCKWWHDALNKLIHCEYGEVPGRFTAAQNSNRAGIDTTYAAAKAAFAADSWSSWNNVTNFEPYQSMYHDSSIVNKYRGTRLRYRIRPDAPFQPGIYANNYLVTSWAKFTTSNRTAFTKVYDNPDYPCNIDTYAKVWDDTDVQSGVYDKDITVGDFDTITASEPAADTERGWRITAIGSICRFDISGGFEYVAP